jgi:uncharacterized protein (DUF1330 family)
MAAYQVSICKITAATPALMEYIGKAAPILAAYGGKYIVRGAADTVLEGEALKGVSVIVSEWPSIEAAKEFYNSPDYQSIKGLRDNTGIYDIGVFPAV